jgi:alpha/beta superfamily hydrolase
MCPLRLAMASNKKLQTFDQQLQPVVSVCHPKPLALGSTVKKKLDGKGS